MPFFATDDGVRLYYELWGSGEPVLIVEPGVFASIGQARWAEELTREGLSVLAYDRRGTGRSDRPQPTAENYSAERLVRDTISLTDDLGASSVIALGWFDGAFRAVRRAIDRPDQTVALVLCGPALPGLSVPEAFDATFQTLVDMGFNYALPAFIEGGNPDATEEQKELAVEMLRDSTTSEIAVAMWAAVEEESEIELEELIGRVACPALVIAGTADIVVPLEYAARVASVLPDGRLVKIEGAGAGMWFTRPEETLAAIRELIRSLDLVRAAADR